MASSRPFRQGSYTGFTLLELLTVVAIIALLIGILLPSLSRARDQAKRVKVRATLSAIEKGLEMFQNDFGGYPISREIIPDPITDFPAPPPRWNGLCGAHWLVRAMLGHDLRGVDAEGRSMRDGTVPANQVTMAELETADRRGPYVDGITTVLDTDSRFSHPVDFAPCKRPLFIDDQYNSPILYYRANTRATAPLCWDGRGTSPYGQASPFGFSDPPGVYSLQDNWDFTGLSSDAGAYCFWDFANTGLDLPCHPLGDMGSLEPDRINRPPAFYSKGKTFAGFLHNENALRTSGVVKPYNPETFILVDTGRDGLFGTDDDVTNFE